MSRFRLIRPYEFWHPRLFELPYYLYLAWRCLVRRLPVKYLAKANYALDHGEIGIGSKFRTQLAFPQDLFLPTERLPNNGNRLPAALAFAETHGYPVVLKPDAGSVGKGVTRAVNEQALRWKVACIDAPYLIQQFTPFNVEFGVFYVREHGKSRITGINGKHFPTVIGNGKDTIETLARQHERFTSHWHLFMQDLDTTRIPADGEVVQMSFIGSHTMGCKFTDDSHLLTPEVELRVCDLCDSQPGYNFGRLDVKAASVDAFQEGEFVVIEVNGVASLPTHMFDPEKSLSEAYRIFLDHGRLLVEIACEHRHQPMELLPWREIGARVKQSFTALNASHQNMMKGP